MDVDGGLLVVVLLLLVQLERILRLSGLLTRLNGHAESMNMADLKEDIKAEIVESMDRLDQALGQIVSQFMESTAPAAGAGGLGLESIPESPGDLLGLIGGLLRSESALPPINAPGDVGGAGGVPGSMIPPPGS
jgi:hypothetical protein